jgi:hypothetical protein
LAAPQIRRDGLQDQKVCGIRLRVCATVSGELLEETADIIYGAGRVAGPLPLTGLRNNWTNSSMGRAFR